MCLLIASYKKVKNVEGLENGYCNNSHGAGFCYSYDKKLIVKKGFFSFNEFLSEYEKIPEDAPNLVHFRLATGGKLNEENCHPFLVNENLAFAHNGIFSFIQSDSQYSDTYNYNEVLMKPIFSKGTNYLVFKPEMKYILEKLVNYNKVAYLNNFGQISILNEKQGDWIDEVWWSNSSWKFSSKFFRGKDSRNKVGNSCLVAGSSGQKETSIPSYEKYLEDIFNEYLQGENVFMEK